MQDRLMAVGNIRDEIERSKRRDREE